jgi:hypothetical protein
MKKLTVGYWVVTPASERTRFSEKARNWTA